MDKTTWGNELAKLSTIIRKDNELDRAKISILKLHALVYMSEMSGINELTFEDELWGGLNEDAARKAVNRKGRTVLYGLWHTSRIEDITMNLLVAGKDQLFEKDGWFSRVGSPVRHTGNSLTGDEILKMSSMIRIDQLKAYRIAVGRNSQEIIRDLKPGEMKRKVYKENLQRILDEGAVDNVESANWLIDFWGRKDIAGIILMPCLRHQLVHINESLSAKNKYKP